MNIEDKLEEAIIRYVDEMDVCCLVSYVAEDLWGYYKKSADKEEVLEFITKMEVE